MPPLPSTYNKAVFSKNVALYATSYWRSDEAEAVKFLRDGSLLIGGVGGGRTVAPLMAKGFIVTAIDLSEEMLKLTKRRYPNLPVVCGNIQHTPFQSASFDSIFLPWHTICYVDDVDLTLKEMHRILKIGGTLVFSMVNNWHLMYGPPSVALTGRYSAWGIRGFPLRKQPIDRHRKATADYLIAKYGSMRSIRRIKRIFPFVAVHARVSLQDPVRLKWTERLLTRLPFFDKSLYFFCRK